MKHRTLNRRAGSKREAARHWPLLLIISAGVLSGCVTSWEKSALLKDRTPNIDNIQGPTQRRLNLAFWKRRTEATDESSSLKALPGTEELLAAKEMYNDGKYPEAQKEFKKVAKKYKKSDIREEALFMQGESAFQQDHYSKAQDLYAVLLRDYPSTRYLDVVSERLFKIGRIWLDFPEVATLNEIKQVNFDEPKVKMPAEEPPKLNNSPVFVPNFRDQSRPLFDTPGNGVSALTAIWMNDPTGPLADDAMMLVASHYARTGNYVEADRYFKMLRETFPNSPHLEQAFLLGSHVKLMTYQGPDFDGKSLSDAEALKKSTLSLFPNISEKDRLRIELTRIQDAKAERDWKLVEYWLRRKDKRATCVACHMVISNHPESKYAEQARDQLEQLGPEYVSGAVLLNPVDPKKPKLWQRILPVARTKPMPPPPNSAEMPSGRSVPNGDSFKSEPEKPKKSPSWLPQRTAPPPPKTRDSEDPESDHETDSRSIGVASGSKQPEQKQYRFWNLWPAPNRLPADTESNAKRISDKSDSGKATIKLSEPEVD